MVRMLNEDPSSPQFKVVCKSKKPTDYPSGGHSHLSLWSLSNSHFTCLLDSKTVILVFHCQSRKLTFSDPINYIVALVFCRILNECRIVRCVELKVPPPEQSFDTLDGCRLSGQRKHYCGVALRLPASASTPT